MLNTLTEKKEPRIGIDLGGTKIEGLVLAPSGNELARRRIATPKGDYAGCLRTIADIVAALEDDAGCQRGLATVGIGMPGAIDPRTGLVQNANATWLIGRPFDRDAALALNRPVRVANDANCLAVSEATDGAAAGAAIVFAVILGTGVGGGLAIGGAAHSGRHAIAGEWGHNPLPWPRAEELPGPRCYCGKAGCLETWLSGPGLAADHAREADRPISGPEIVQAAEAGDAAAQATLARHRDRLARGLATVINTLDPDAIVIGGGLSRIASLYDALPGLLAPWVFTADCKTPIRPARHGDSSGVRGAAWLW